MRVKLREIKDQLRRRMHQAIPEQRRWLAQVIRGYFAKTKLVEFGRFAQRHAGKRGRNRPETIYFLGLTLYCTRNPKGNFKVVMRAEKSRLRRPSVSAGADAARST